MPALVPPEPGIERSLHRKNAAEWVMWAVLLPLVPVMWAIERLRRARESMNRG